MSVMAPTRSRRTHRAGARRNDRPQRCQRCLDWIVWAKVLEPDGSLRRYVAGERQGGLVHIPLNAKPLPTGKFEYVRGTVGRPVVRELDELERLIPAEVDRYQRHYDVPAGER